MGKRSVSLLRMGPTGPRTPSGKAKSRFNALKHGILASAAVLETESPDEYSGLVSQLAENLAPVGKLEETLVEKIATTIWRYRRLLKAEAAEIAEANLMQEKTYARRLEDKMLANTLWGQGGAMQKALLSEDAGSLFEAADSMKRLRERILDDGLDWGRDKSDLEELLFGKVSGEEAEIEASDTTFRGTYLRVLRESEGQSQKSKSAAVQGLVDKLSGDIDFVQGLAMGSVSRREKLDSLRATTALVPETKVLERVIRYEAHLERTLDRALSQLERLQRMRLGQPVPPPLRVEVSK